MSGDSATVLQPGQQSETLIKKKGNHDASAHLTFVQGLELPNFGDDKLPRGPRIFVVFGQGVS